MAWSDLKVDQNAVQGLAEQLLTSRQSGQFDASRITPEREAAARGELEDALFDERAGGLAKHVATAGSRTQLLDAIEAESELQKPLKRGLALAFLTLYAPDTAVTPGSMRAERGEGLTKKLSRWARSFGAVAPHALGYVSSSSRKGRGGALASTMGTYDRSTITGITDDG